jgi:hypothetical protein
MVRNSERHPLTLKFRPTCLGCATDKDRVDYTIFSGEWEIGPVALVADINGPMMRSGHAANPRAAPMSEDVEPPLAGRRSI